MTVLDGPLARLRPIAESDLPSIFAWYNDPALVAPFDRFSVDSFDAFARSVAEAADDPASLAPRFAIERRPAGDVVGVVGHYRAHPVLEYTDVWYVIGVPDARGHGLGRAAVELLVSHLFSTVPLARVGATCDVDNVASYRLLEGIGFRREGTLRSALFHHEAWHDVFVYGITAEEWRRRPARA